MTAAAVSAVVRLIAQAMLYAFDLSLIWVWEHLPNLAQARAALVAWGR